MFFLTRVFLKLHWHRVIVHSCRNLKCKGLLFSNQDLFLCTWILEIYNILLKFKNIHCQTTSLHTVIYAGFKIWTHFTNSEEQIHLLCHIYLMKYKNTYFIFRGTSNLLISLAFMKQLRILMMEKKDYSKK